MLAPGHDASLQELFAALPGAQARRATRAGALPPGAPGEHATLPALRADPFCVPDLDRFLAASGRGWPRTRWSLLQEAREQHARAAGLVALSSAEDAELEVQGLGGELKPFQRAGVAYLLTAAGRSSPTSRGSARRSRRSPTLQADDAFPAIVVCPANLKLNWRRETEAWLPGRTVRVLSGLDCSRRAAARRT